MSSKACEVVFKRLWPMFGLIDESIAVQLIRLVVLFEDLRIETIAATERRVEILDENSAEYRKMYFVRRGYATLVEMGSALFLLNQSPEFKAYRRKFFAPSDDASWDASVKFFHANWQFFKNERNAYGGHFHDAAARFGFLHLNPETTGPLEIGYIGSKRTWRIRFRFALHFVGVALTTNKGEREIEEYIHDCFDKLTDGFQFSTSAIHLLAKHFILPKFGANLEPTPQAK